MSASERREGGFTLVELLIALLILGVVLSVIAPAIWGILRAGVAANYRSTANGLAVAATEEIRSLRYFEVGYSSRGTIPGSCTASNPVTLPSGVTTALTPVTTTQIDPVAYTVTRCIYWIDSSANLSGPGTPGDSQAYKQSVITVSWSVGAISSQVSQTSAIYPGGEAGYLGPQNDYVPGGTTTTLPGGVPNPPASVSAVDDANSPTTIIDVSWTPPASSPDPPVNYIVEYEALTPGTGGCPTSLPATPSPTSAVPEPASASPLAISVSSGTTYCIQVVSVDAAGNQSVTPSPVATATTASNNGKCSPQGLTVSPSPGVVDSSGHLVNSSSFQLTVALGGSCGNVTVGYSTTGTAVLQATLSGVANALSGTAGGAGTVWAAGTHSFTVYVNGSPSATQQLVDICQQKGKSGHC